MSTSVLKALPGKLDIKRHSPSILYLCGTLVFYLTCIWFTDILLHIAYWLFMSIALLFNNILPLIIYWHLTSCGSLEAYFLSFIDSSLLVTHWQLTPYGSLEVYILKFIDGLTSLEVYILKFIDGLTTVIHGNLLLMVHW